MTSIDQLGVAGVSLVAFATMFVCASLVRARGVTGLLALTGAITVAVLILVDLHDVRLSVGGIAAMVGIALGGKVSDYRERQRLNKIREAERKKRDAYMKGGVAGGD